MLRVQKTATFFRKLPFLLEQATGIEPARSAWEAEVLPLNYACKKIGAGNVTRTRDLRITNALLYQLSYSGMQDIL